MGGLPLPDAGHIGLACRGWHPGWLLLLRHHLEVRGGPLDLSDHLCQVETGDFARSRLGRQGATLGNVPMRWHAAVFFSGAIFDPGPPHHTAPSSAVDLLARDVVSVSA